MEGLWMVMFLYSCIFQFFQWAYIAIMLIKTMTIFRVGKSFIVIKITLYKSLIPYGVSFLLLPAHLPFPSFSIRRAFSVSFYTLGLNMDALALAKEYHFWVLILFLQRKSLELVWDLSREIREWGRSCILPLPVGA